MSQKTPEPQQLNTLLLAPILSTKDKRNRPSPPSAILSLETLLFHQKKSSKIPQELIQNYQDQGYTHLHLRAVRLILTLHGRRSLPVTAKVALLDSTFMENQHALIGALVTTLSNRSFILTIAPNFTVRLSDPTICYRLKIQIQLVGGPLQSQDHALDLNLPNTTGEALFMFIDNARGPSIVNILRMITTEELSSIIPLEWIIDYEKAFLKEQVDIHTTTPPTIAHNSDGMMSTFFQKPGVIKQTLLRGPSFRRINMISPIQVQTTHNQDDPLVHFYKNEKPDYNKHVSHINGHFIWDVDPSMCDSDCDCADQWSDTDDEDYDKHQRDKKKKKRPQQAPCSYKRHEPPDDADMTLKLRKKRLSQKGPTGYLY
ncbi:hypothetical protein AHAS_Ahas19G0266300 [Arachis hypogaea]